jgi:hypothetical protein
VAGKYTWEVINNGVFVSASYSRREFALGNGNGG